MGTRARVPGAAACALLLVACHGPPIMSRIRPRPLTPTRPAAPVLRRPDILRVPSVSGAERPEDLVSEQMIDDIERAIRLRQEARRPPADPCSQIIERARRANHGPRVGQEERGCIPLPVMQLWNLLKKELSK